MANVEAHPLAIIQKYRTRLASTWLARFRVTAAPAIRAMIGQTSITVHSANSAELLLRFEWGGEIIIVETAEPCRLYEFASLDASLPFIDAVLLHSAYALMEPDSLAPASLMDEAFWQVISKKEVAARGTPTNQKVKLRSPGGAASPRATTMDTAAMGSWVSAWGL